MEVLKTRILKLFSDEHQDWATHLKDAEKAGTYLDTTDVSHGHSARLNLMLVAFGEYEERHKKKKGFFGR